MCRIVDLMRLQLTRGISNNLFLLHKDRTQSLQRGVTEYLERRGCIRRNQDWSGSELLFECLKACLTCRSPKIFLAFLEEIGKRLRYFREVLNEATTIIAKPRKLRTSLTLTGGSHSTMVFTVSGLTAMP